jgi:3-oxoacyl-[acyl-carrier protein] reductase
LTFHRQDLHKESALKHLAQLDDIGGVVAFLASEDARWISGKLPTWMAGWKL